MYLSLSNLFFIFFDGGRGIFCWLFHFVLREFYLVCYVVVLFVWFCSVRFGFVFVFKEEEYVSPKMSNVDIDM